MTVDRALEQAKNENFSHFAPLDAGTLDFMPQVRDMCAADKCRRYGTSWMCPPGCGSLEDSLKKAREYEKGIIVQTTGVLDDVFDYDEMKNIGTRHMVYFRNLRRALLKDYPNLLALGAGACGVCEKCGYPNEPCRFPDEAVPSMEAYGLLVSKVCEDNGLGYYYGEGTLTYTGCFLLF